MKTQPKEQINIDTLLLQEWEYAVVLFYNYVTIEDPEIYREVLREKCKELGITGRFIVSSEGINGIGETDVARLHTFCEWLLSDDRFSDTHLKFSKSEGDSFPRLSVKSRTEIVSLHLGGDDFDPNETTGKRLTPEDLHEWYELGKDFTIIDMRNNYEHEIGHFVGSVLPPLNNFRDLRQTCDSLKEFDDEEKPILTVCTGGVRCEKASGYLVKQGFKNVYQLDGGMVSYMEKFPGQNFLGGMYTFDGRRVIDWDNGQHEVIGKCLKCASPCERLVDCLNPECNKQYIACEGCDPNRKTTFCCAECHAHGPAKKKDGSPAKNMK
jgi:UPF0176 protein